MRHEDQKYAYALTLAYYVTASCEELGLEQMCEPTETGLQLLVDGPYAAALFDAAQKMIDCPDRDFEEIALGLQKQILSGSRTPIPIVHHWEAKTRKAQNKWINSKPWRRGSNDIRRGTGRYSDR